MSDGTGTSRDGDGQVQTDRGHDRQGASRGGLDRVFNPRSIAVVGASGDPSRIGGRPIHYLKLYGFKGDVYPINPKRETIQDLKAYASLIDVPGEIDVVILAIPAAGVLDALEQAAAKGASGVVIFSSGFAETGAAGQAAQDRIVARGRELGMRIMGPNTLGFYAGPSRAVATFSTFFESGDVPEGTAAIVSQSGAFGADLANKAIRRGIGLRYWVTTGNEADVSTTDVIRTLAKDPELRVIALYLEGVRDGRALMTAISEARSNGTRVVVIKVGRTPVGSQAAQSHTASLAGDDAVFDRAMEQAGAVRVIRADHLLDALYVLDRGKDLPGDKLGIMSVSGGAGVLMADAAHDANFAVPPMPEAAQARLHEASPMGSPTNPVDVTGQALNDMTLITDHLRTMFDEGGYDALVGFFMNWLESPLIAERTKEAVLAGIEGFDDRTIALIAVLGREARQDLESRGLLIFDDPTAGIEALALLRRQAGRGDGRDWRAPAAAPAAPLPDSLNEYDSLQAVAAAGVAIPDIARAATAEEAGAAAAKLGGRVALKILSPDIAHKTEAGGVALNLEGEADTTRAARDMAAAVARHAPDARIDGFLVAPMVKGCAECIVGVRVDPIFGPVVMVGLGGVHAEVFRDVALSVAPVTRDDAVAMLRSLRSWPLLDGARGAAKADVAALADTIVALSDFAIAHREGIEAVELNPVSVGAAGEGVRALDAFIDRRSAT